MTSTYFLFFVLVLMCAFIMVRRIQIPTNELFVPELFFISATVVFAVHQLFYFFSPYFLNLNVIFPPETYTPPIQKWIGERDGAEGFVIYGGMFISLLVCWITSWIVKTFKSQTHKIIAIGCCFLATVFFVCQLGWNPPMPEISADVSSIFCVFAGIIIFAVVLLWIGRFNFNSLFAVIAVLLIPVCFIAVRSFELFDYSFIWAPGYRILNGYPLSQIYFQYDLLLSLLAAGWMKLGWDLGYFQLLGQLSFYLFFLCCLFFAKRFFLKPNVYIFFFISVLIVRYFAIMDDPTLYFQVAPLRLDLWLLLVILVFYKGIYHWSTALALGLMIVLHKNFGLLYFGSYVQLVLLLAVVDYIDFKNGKANSWTTTKQFILEQVRLNYKNAIILVGFISVAAFLFGGLVPTSALLYQKIGIGMMPVSGISFYWYVAILLGVALLTLLHRRLSFPRQYFVTGCFMLFIAIANSMYFFGRSHEHNIINISAIFVFIFFLLVDMMFVNQKQAEVTAGDMWVEKMSAKRNVFVYIIGFIFLMACGYTYSGRIAQRLKQQYGSLIALNFGHVKIEEGFRGRVERIKELTNHSDRVYIFDLKNDFIQTYVGGYKPVEYFFPVAASIFNKEMFDGIQSLLNDGYYVAIDSGTLREYRTIPLTYTRLKSDADLVVLKLGDDFLKPSEIQNFPTSGDDVQAYVDGISDSLSYYKIEGWSFVKDKDDSNSTISLLLKSSTHQFRIDCAKRYRPDLKDAFRHSFNTDESGFESRLKKVYFHPGEYEIFVLIENSGVSYVKSLDRRITF